MKIQTETNHKTRNLNGSEVLVSTDELKKELRLVGNIASFQIDESVVDGEGACYLGGGICIDVVQPRKRQTNRLIFVESVHYSNASNAKALQPALDYINEYYPNLNAYYYEGRID